MVIFWLVAGVLLVVLEAVTAALISIWFVGGAAAALIAALCGGPLWLQIGLFVVMSALLLLVLRPFLRKQIKGEKERTNVDANLGKYGVVTETIDNLNGSGHILIDHADWTARSMDGANIAVGSRVVVRKIEGVRAWVELAPAAEPEQTAPV